MAPLIPTFLCSTLVHLLRELQALHTVHSLLTVFARITL